MIRVLVNGCFDNLHEGHIQFLKWAETAGDVLVIAINSDESVRKLKGIKRPIQDSLTRYRAVCSRFPRAEVRIFNGDVLALAHEIQPDVVVRGWDQTIEEGLTLIHSIKRIAVAPKFGDVSTTSKSKCSCPECAPQP
jgi:cytidyltransferase-like protein